MCNESENKASRWMGSRVIVRGRAVVVHDIELAPTELRWNCSEPLCMDVEHLGT
jgi:hypothetical protein